jgi:hypothetical protein
MQKGENFHPHCPLGGMSRRVERILVRTFVAVALTVGLLASAMAPVPRNASGSHVLPAIALEHIGLYRLEVALLAFYGGLLLGTPVFSGLVRGRLPTEISARRAKFAEEAKQSDELAEATIRELWQTMSRLGERISAAEAEIDQLQDEGDNR